MKKKWIMLGSVGISGVVMVSTGISAMASTSGYDAYKSAFKTTKSVQSVTVQAQAVLQDNGNVLTSADGDFKWNQQNRTGSGNVTVDGNGTEQSLSFYKQAEGTVLKSSGNDIYYVKQNHKEKRDAASKKQDNQEMSLQVETVIDALVGNLKDYVTVDNKADGMKEVSLDLSNVQIPAVVNAIAPIVIKEATKQHKYENLNKDDSKEIPFDEHTLLANVPQLSQNIKIEKVAVNAEINASNFIESQQADITVSGKDTNGTTHQVTLHLSADLSNYNSTTPDTVDLTGKQVQQMKQEHRENHQ